MYNKQGKEGELAAEVDQYGLELAMFWIRLIDSIQKT